MRQVEGSGKEKQMIGGSSKGRDGRRELVEEN